jgi:hypothetical protein
MPRGSPPDEDIGPTQGLTGGIAGGPGPTPPGFTDGTEPRPPTGDAPPQALPEDEAQESADRVAGASGGRRDVEVPERPDQPMPEH